MKKVVVSGLLLATLAAVTYLLTPAAAAQQRDRIPPALGAWNLALEGPGSSIGVTVRDQPGDASGVVIDSVREGTPATRAGLQKGDVVVEFDGERARSAQQFTRLVRETAPGRSVKMTVVRDGSRRTLDITPETRDSVTLQQFPQVTADVFRALPRDFEFSFDQRGHWGERALERSTGDVLRGQRRRVGVGGLERHAGSNGGRAGRRRDHCRERS